MNTLSPQRLHAAPWRCGKAALQSKTAATNLHRTPRPRPNPTPMQHTAVRRKNERNTGVKLQDWTEKHAERRRDKCKDSFTDIYIYIYIWSQATGLARQLLAYVAQDPTTVDIGTGFDAPIGMNYETHRHTISNQPQSETYQNSDSQDAVLLGRYPEKIRIASLNCRGLATLPKRERVIHLMVEHDIDVLCLQETKINHNSREEHDSFVMYWSSGVADDDRNKAEELKRSEKARRNNPADAETFRRAIEHLGVRIVYKQSFQKYVVNIVQKSARTIMLTLQMRTGCLDIFSAYVPQACHNQEQQMNTTRNWAPG